LVWLVDVGRSAAAVQADVTPASHLCRSRSSDAVRAFTPNAATRVFAGNAERKARAEFIVAPILLEVREQLHETISIYSGVRFDVSPEEGVYDFLITKSPPLPAVQTPVIVLVEAKKNGLEEGLGQCGAEMLAAQRVNLGDNLPNLTV
jgi:hypothetical protein